MRNGDGTINRVEFRLDSGTWVVGSGNPYQYNFGKLSAGSHTISYRSLDNDGSFSTTSTVNFSVVTVPVRRVIFIHTDLQGSPAAESDDQGNSVQ